MRLQVASCLLAAIGVTGCASIVNGQNQSLSVEARSDGASVAGAACTLANDKGTWLLTTPGSVVVQRSFAELSVKCEKRPLEPGLAVAKSGVKGMAFGNILFGGIIGAGVDMATGAAYDYAGLITVHMGKMTVVASPAIGDTGADGGTGKRQPKYGDADCVLIPGASVCREVKATPASSPSVPAVSKP